MLASSQPLCVWVRNVVVAGQQDRTTKYRKGIIAAVGENDSKELQVEIQKLFRSHQYLPRASLHPPPPPPTRTLSASTTAAQQSSQCSRASSARNVLQSSASTQSRNEEAGRLAKVVKVLLEDGNVADNIVRLGGRASGVKIVGN